MSLILSFIFSAFAQDARIYEIKGMHCDGCIQSVKQSVCKLPGIKTCDVTLNKVQLTGDGIDDEAVKAAVGKAGGDDYKVISVEHTDAAHAKDIKPQPGPTLKTEATDKMSCNHEGKHSCGNCEGHEKMGECKHDKNTTCDKCKDHKKCGDCMQGKECSCGKHKKGKTKK